MNKGNTTRKGATIPVKGKGKGNAPTPVKGKGRGGAIDALTPVELQREIDELLNDLRDVTLKGDRQGGKRIRRALRARGHFGGLMHERNAQRDDVTPVKSPARPSTPAGKGKKMPVKFVKGE